MFKMSDKTSNESVIAQKLAGPLQSRRVIKMLQMTGRHNCCRRTSKFRSRKHKHLGNERTMSEENVSRSPKDVALSSKQYDKNNS